MVILKKKDVWRGKTFLDEEKPNECPVSHQVKSPGQWYPLATVPSHIWDNEKGTFVAFVFSSSNNNNKPLAFTIEKRKR